MSVFFHAAEQHPVCSVERSPRASDLLIIGYHRSRRLVMNHEGEIWFVKAHSQRRPCHQRLHPVVEQGLFQGGPPLARLARIRRHIQATCPEPFGHLYCIPYRQGVDDAVALQGRHLCGQPGQTLRLTWQAYCLQRQRWSVQVAAQNIEIGSEHCTQDRPSPCCSRWRWSLAAVGSVAAYARCVPIAGSAAGSRGPSPRCSAPHRSPAGQSERRCLPDLRAEALIGQSLG